MIFGHSNYRDFLKSAYVERRERNPRFSQRSFAKTLGLSPAGLNRILGGTKQPSLDRAVALAERLQLDERESEYFCLLVQLEHTRKPELRASLLRRLKPFREQDPIQDLSVDYFKMISDWYHFAILEMIQTEGAKLTPAHVSRYLGISSIEASLAIERLQRLELIEVKEDGTAARLANRLIFESKVPNEALRKYNRQILEKAIECLESQTQAERIVGTETFAFDPAALGDAIKLTDQYLDSMQKLARASPQRRDVYQLSVQCFRLNQPNHQPLSTVKKEK